MSSDPFYEAAARAKRDVSAWVDAVSREYPESNLEHVLDAFVFGAADAFCWADNREPLLLEKVIRNIANARDQIRSVIYSSPQHGPHDRVPADATYESYNAKVTHDVQRRGQEGETPQLPPRPPAPRNARQPPRSSTLPTKTPDVMP